jgi:hypothetical protein
VSWKHINNNHDGGGAQDLALWVNTGASLPSNEQQVYSPPPPALPPRRYRNNGLDSSDPVNSGPVVPPFDDGTNGEMTIRQDTYANQLRREAQRYQRAAHGGSFLAATRTYQARPAGSQRDSESLLGAPLTVEQSSGLQPSPSPPPLPQSSMPYNRSWSGEYSNNVSQQQYDNDAAVMVTTDILPPNVGKCSPRLLEPVSTAYHNEVVLPTASDVANVSSRRRLNGSSVLSARHSTADIGEEKFVDCRQRSTVDLSTEPDVIQDTPHTNTETIITSTEVFHPLKPAHSVQPDTQPTHVSCWHSADQPVIADLLQVDTRAPVTDCQTVSDQKGVSKKFTKDAEGHGKRRPVLTTRPMSGESEVGSQLPVEHQQVGSQLAVTVREGGSQLSCGDILRPASSVARRVDTAIVPPSVRSPVPSSNDSNKVSQPVTVKSLTPEVTTTDVPDVILKPRYLVRRKSPSELCYCQHVELIIKHLRRISTDEPLTDCLLQPTERKMPTDYMNKVLGITHGAEESHDLNDLPELLRKRLTARDNKRLAVLTSSPTQPVDRHSVPNSFSSRSRSENMKKEELVEVLVQMLNTLKVEKAMLEEEIMENNKLGLQVKSVAEVKLQHRELDKYLTYLRDVDMVVNLLLRLSDMLARAENAICCLPQNASDKQKASLISRRDELLQKHEDARLLRCDIDDRSRQVIATVHKLFTLNELIDHTYFITMKTQLAVEQQEVDNYIQLVDKQLKMLRMAVGIESDC